MLQTKGNMHTQKPPPYTCLPEPHCSSSMLKASTKNAELFELNKNNRNLENEHKASAKRAQNRLSPSSTSSGGRHPVLKHRQNTKSNQICLI